MLSGSAARLWCLLIGIIALLVFFFFVGGRASSTVAEIGGPVTPLLTCAAIVIFACSVVSFAIGSAVPESRMVTQAEMARVVNVVRGGRVSVFLLELGDLRLQQASKLNWLTNTFCGMHLQMCTVSMFNIVVLLLLYVSSSNEGLRYYALSVQLCKRVAHSVQLPSGVVVSLSVPLCGPS